MRHQVVEVIQITVTPATKVPNKHEEADRVKTTDFLLLAESISIGDQKKKGKKPRPWQMEQDLNPWNPSIFKQTHLKNRTPVLGRPSSSRALVLKVLGGVPQLILQVLGPPAPIFLWRATFFS